MAIDIGKLRHRISLQRRSTARDDFNQPLDTWTTYATIWARVAPSSGREVLQSNQIQAETTHAVTMRFLSSVAPKDRVLFGTRIFDINSVINQDELNCVMELSCSEVSV